MKLDYYNPRHSPAERRAQILRRLRLPALTAAFGLTGLLAGFLTHEQMLQFVGEPLWRRGLQVSVGNGGESMAAAARWALAVAVTMACAPVAAALWGPDRGRRFVVRSVLFWVLAAIIFVPSALFVGWRFEHFIAASLPPDLPYEPMIGFDVLPLMRAPLSAAAVVLLTATARRVYSLTHPAGGSNIPAPSGNSSPS